MKKRAILPISCIIALISCTGAPDFDVVNPNEQATNTESIKENVQKVFGVTFDPNHDWCSTISGEVAITANSSIKKVQVIAYLNETGENGEPVTAMRVMNEAELNGKTSVTLNYDAPNDNLGLFVAFISDKGYKVKQVENNKANYNDVVTRALPEQFVLPTTIPALGEPIPSYASERYGLENELLWEMTDYSSMKMTYENMYSDEFTAALRAVVFSCFKNKQKNLQRVKDSGIFNDNAYPITTGKDPIIVSPVYKCDKAKQYGNEIWNSDLYYYYFDESNPDYQANPVAYLQSLPKYKAMPFKDCFGETEDDKIHKTCSYALVYYEGSPETGMTGSFTFPEGLKIGFMVRAKTDYAEKKKDVDDLEIPRKQGELYGDGRLNNSINNDKTYNFSSSNLGTDGPRIAWISFNNKDIMCWESGTDSDFNDVLIEVEGGVDIPFIPIDPEYNTYTYCFEDRQMGDYDMNDVVIKAVRTSDTNVDYYVVACGAYDSLYIQNIDDKLAKQEVHTLFLGDGASTRLFINTEKNGKKYEFYKVSKKVLKTFRISDPETAPKIYNATTKLTVELSKKGEDPHGIIIPNNFKYPLEKVCIKNAYLEFNDWGQNPIISTFWYQHPEEEQVFK